MRCPCGTVLLNRAGYVSHRQYKGFKLWPIALHRQPCWHGYKHWQLTQHYNAFLLQAWSAGNLQDNRSFSRDILCAIHLDLAEEGTDR